MHNYTPSTYEAEEGGFQVGGQSGQCRGTASQDKRAGDVHQW